MKHQHLSHHQGQEKLTDITYDCFHGIVISCKTKIWDYKTEKTSKYQALLMERMTAN
jgi:hypothetical protein